MPEKTDIDAEDEKRNELIHHCREDDGEDERIHRKDGLLDDRGVVREGGRRTRDPLVNRHPREEPGHQELRKGRESPLDGDAQDDRKDGGVEDHPEDRMENRPDHAEPRARITRPYVSDDQLFEEEKLGRNATVVS